MTNSTKDESEAEVLQRLAEMLKGGEATIFTKEEVEMLRKMIKVYQGLLALGWTGTFLRKVILIVVTIVGAYAALTGALAEWVKKIAVGG